MVVLLMLLGALSLSTILLAWYLVGYPLAMGIVALRRGQPDHESDTMLFVTIIIPTYNEKNVVERRVDDLVELNYPVDKYEIIFVDSDSEDNTVDVLRDYLANVEGPEMTIIEESERKGKGSAINIGMQEASGDIVLVSDANTQFDPDLLDHLIPHFKDPAVGGVTGSLQAPSQGEGIDASNQLYRELEQMKGMGESRLDSVCQLHGEISAWRKHLATADTTCLSEDLDLSLQIRQQGYELRYEPKAIAYEPDPNTPKELITSNKRRLIGAIQASLKHRGFLASPADLYRTLIYPSRKLLQLVSPLLFLVSLVAVVGLVTRKAYSVLRQYLLFSLLGTVCIGGALIAVKKRTIPSSGNLDLSPHSILDTIQYLVIMQYTIVLAWKDFLVGDYSVLWQKSESDRQARQTDTGKTK